MEAAVLFTWSRDQNQNVLVKVLHLTTAEVNYIVKGINIGLSLTLYFALEWLLFKFL